MSREGHPRLLEVEVLVPIKAPARSPLFHLAPIAVGTAYAESLTSYIGRLAYHHSLSPTMLFRWAISQCGNAFAVETFQSQDPRLKMRDAYLWNGMGSIAAAVVEIFSQQTRRTDLSFTTAIRYDGYFTPISLRRKYRAWCPICLQEARDRSMPVYEPLSWYLDGVGACTHHGVHLSTICPAGCVNLPVLAGQSIPGHCSLCSTWLGGAGSEYRGRLAGETELWIARSAGEMIACMRPGKPDRSIGEMIHLGANVLFDGKLAHFANHLGKAKTTVWTWVNGSGLLTLKDLMLISHSFQIPFMDLIQGRSDCWDQATISRRRMKVTRAARTGDWTAIGRYLRNSLVAPVLSPQSVLSIARQHGVSERLLRHHYPAECREISARYMRAVSIATTERWRQEEDVIRKTLQTLLDEGETPTARGVAIRMGRSYAIWKNRKRRDILLRLMNELEITAKG